jgi:regulator of cell morphogenesis and NO signaling
MATASQSIREIVSKQSSAAAILQRFEIDLCLHAEESLKQACANLQLSIDQVLEKLSEAEEKENGDLRTNVAGYSLSRLIQHVVRTHHQYVRSELPRLAEMANKLVGEHGDGAPELKQVENLINALHAELLAHICKEEQVLFPFIAQLDQEPEGRVTLNGACFETVTQPVSKMVREHQSVENLAAEMRTLTNGFSVPAWACPTYIALYAGLNQFDADLRQHLHVESEILFPRAIEMESALSVRS